MRLNSYIKRAVFCAIVAMLATMIITFVVTREVETLFGGLLFGLFIVPSIIIYYVLDFFSKPKKVKIIGFLVPVLGMIILGALGIFIDSQDVSSDGSGEMSKLLMINLLIGSIVVLCICLRTTKK